MTIYSGFSHEKWWFSIVMLVYQRVPRKIATPPPRLTACCCSTRCRSDNMLLAVEELSYAEWMNIRAVSNQKSCFNSWETGNSTGKKWKKKRISWMFHRSKKIYFLFSMRITSMMMTRHQSRTPNFKFTADLGSGWNIEKQHVSWLKRKWIDKKIFTTHESA